MTRLRIVLAIAIACVMFGTGSVQAQDSDAVTFSASADLVSDYVWRGVSQSDEDPAIQGGFELSASGFYVGAWGSNVDFNEIGVDGADLELDGIVGYRFDATEDVAFDLGLCNYFYPGTEADYDFLEVYAGVSWKWFGFNAAYSNDVFATDLSGLYLSTSLSFDLSGGFGVSAGLGQYLFDEEVNGIGAPDSYLDWSVGVSWSQGKATIGLTYYGTNSDGETLFGDWAGDRIVLGISASI